MLDELYIGINEVKMLLKRHVEETEEINKQKKEKIIDSLQTENVTSYLKSKNICKSKKERQYYKGYSDAMFKAIEIIRER